MTFTAYARRRGWTQPYVSQLVKAGVIPLSQDRKIDPEAADAAVAAHRDPSKEHVVDRHAEKRATQKAAATGALGKGPRKRGAKAPVRQSEFQVARTMRETFAARQARLDYEREAGKLVERRRVDQAAADVASVVDRGLRKLVDGLASRLAAESDPRRIATILSTEIDAMRTQLADAVTSLPETLTAARH
jgi:hypothetical protein